jgi:hypothetical protein
VRFTTAAALVSELIEARDDRHLLRFQKLLASYELLVVDELGYVPLIKERRRIAVRDPFPALNNLESRLTRNHLSRHKGQSGPILLWTLQRNKCYLLCDFQRSGE